MHSLKQFGIQIGMFGISNNVSLEDRCKCILRNMYTTLSLFLYRHGSVCVQYI